MKVARYPIRISKAKTTLVLGAFDSFHFGHIALIDEAKKLRCPVTLMMIENPSNLPSKNSSSYCDFDTRLIQAANLGIDQTQVIKFNEEIKNMPGEKFLAKLVELTNAINIVVGKDFAMGFNKDTNAEKILKLYPDKTIIVNPVKFSDAKLSTTTLKELVETGAVDVIKKLSPFSYTITTRVTAEKTFEYETTKLQRGVYATFVIVNDIKFWSLVKIGFESNLIIVPDLNIVNSGFDARIEFRKMIRIIVRKDQDDVSAEDKAKVVAFLLNNNA